MAVLYQGHAIGNLLNARRHYIQNVLHSKMEVRDLLGNDTVMSHRQLRPPMAWELISVLPDARLYSFFTSADLGGYGENEPPNEPSNPYPADGATNIPLVDLTLTWVGGDPDPDDTVVYDVYFGTDADPALMVEDLSETQYMVTDLEPNTDYFWKVVARDNWDAETEGPVWSFTTVVNHPPYEPVNPVPPNGATNVDQNANLAWECNDPDPGDTLTFSVYFGTVSPPPLVVSDITEFTYDPGEMAGGTVHYWQISARDNWGSETTGPIWSFTTYEGENNPPNTPSEPYPENASADVAIDVTLTWVGGDPDPGDTVTYDLYFGTNPSPPVAQRDLTNPQYTPPAPLDYSTTYYWYVVARDSFFSETAGPLWTFTTEVSPYTPTPTPNPTFTPTSIPTATPTPDEPTPTPEPTEPPEPTDTPIPTETPPTPTPTTEPCIEYSIKLDMGGDYFCPGDPVYLSAKLCNPGPTEYLPVWVILEVEGMFWFAPSWHQDNIDYYLSPLPEGWSSMVIIPEFTWPNVEGEYYGTRFYGAITTTTFEILGDYDMITFGWGPCI